LDDISCKFPGHPTCPGTSTGSVTPVHDVCNAIDAAGHPALLVVDTISSLASVDYRHDEWGVDVTVSGSQKGLMLPPGLSFNAVSEKAMKASESAASKRSYWSWQEMSGPNDTGYFPYTPATNMLYGLNEAIDMPHEEGLDNVFARHERHGARPAPRSRPGCSRCCARCLSIVRRRARCRVMSKRVVTVPRRAVAR